MLTQSVLNIPIKYVPTPQFHDNKKKKSFKKNNPHIFCIYSPLSCILPIVQQQQQQLTHINTVKLLNSDPNQCVYNHYFVQLNSPFLFYLYIIYWLFQ